MGRPHGSRRALRALLTMRPIESASSAATQPRRQFLSRAADGIFDRARAGREDHGEADAEDRRGDAGAMSEGECFTMTDRSNLELVKREISRFLASGEAEVLCIRGKWGVGKTYSWKQYLKEAFMTDKIALSRYSYVSLFGVNSLDELRYAIFENTVPKESITLDANLDTLKSILQSAEGWGRKGAWLVNLVPGLRSYFGGAAPAFFLTIRSQLICIDDLERKGAKLSVGDILGLISFLKDQRRCKIALLLNDGALAEGDRAEFDKYLEKVVDISIEFAPSPLDSAEIAIPGDADLELRRSLLFLGISNIRVIKKIERLTRILEEALADFDPGVLKAVIKSVTLLGWVTFSREDAPTKEFLLHKRRDSVFGLKQNLELNDNEIRWNEILDKFGFDYVDELDLLLLDGIEKGFFDEIKIRHQAAILDEKILSMRGHVSLEEAWRPYHESFDDNLEEVVKSIYEGCLVNAKYLTASSLDAAVRLLKDLHADDRAHKLIDEFLELRREEHDIFDLERNAFVDDIQDEDVIAAFKSERRLTQPTKSPLEALTSIGSGSWSSSDIEVLAKLSTDDFYNLFKSLNGDDLHSAVTAALRFSRIQNLNDIDKPIRDAAKQALMRIGKESALNRRRVMKFGFNVD